jgi:hypothetical protein
VYISLGKDVISILSFVKKNDNSDDDVDYHDDDDDF